MVEVKWLMVMDKVKQACMASKSYEAMLLARLACCVKGVGA